MRQSVKDLISFQIVKDVTNRYKLLQGHKIRYVPGWDCHGLPIEQKALGEVGRDHKNMQPMDIRKAGTYNIFSPLENRLKSCSPFVCNND